MEQRSVLFLARLFYPHVGGVEKHVEKIAGGLRRRGYGITVLTEQYDTSLPLTETYQNVSIIRIPYQQLQSKLALWQWILAHRALFSQAEIIHIHDVFWWILPLSFQLKPKTYITFHGYEGVDAPNARQRFWHQLGERMTSGNICIGGFHEKWYGVKPDITSFGAVEVTKETTPKSNKKIIYLGRLAEDTGIMTYLKGFAKFVEHRPGWQLDVFGDGPQLAECQRFVKKHQLPVFFHGFVANAADKLPEYQIAFVSRYLAILEALANGRQVIAHYNNQIKYDYLALSPFESWIEIVHTPTDVARAIQCGAPIAEKAIEWAHQQSWQEMVDDYENLWKRS